MLFIRSVKLVGSDLTSSINLRNTILPPERTFFKVSSVLRPIRFVSELSTSKPSIAVRLIVSPAGPLARKTVSLLLLVSKVQSS